MVCSSTIFNVLLIDDNVEELALIQRILKALTHEAVCVDHVYKCSEAVNFLNHYSYDLVLLDNRLSGQISAEFSAPFILTALSTAPIAIISHDINMPYLASPDILGVDYIISKDKIITFMRQQYERKIKILERRGPSKSA